MRFLIPSSLVFQFAFVYMRDRYSGQMMRVMRCIVRSSSSPSFPWWQRRLRSWDVILKLFGFVLVQEKTVLMVLAPCLRVCMCNRQCTVKQSIVILSSADVLNSRWRSIPGRAVLPVSSPHWRTTAWVMATTAPWAVLSPTTPTQQWPCTRVILASHPSLSCGSAQQVASVCLWSLQLAAASWSSVVSQFAATVICWGWFPPGWITIDLMSPSMGYTLLFSRAGALTGTGTVDHTSLVQFGSPCPTEEEIARFAAGAARATL